MRGDPVHAAVSAMDREDLLDQFGVLTHAGSGDVGGPFVVAGAADTEQPAGQETGVRAFSAEINR